MAENLAAHIGPGVQGRLSLMPSDMLPETVVGDIFSKAEQQSILMTLGQRVPVSLNETFVTVDGTFPEAGQVGGTTLESREGARKPLAGVTYGSRKGFMPIKLAVIVTVSREYALTNPEGYYSQLTTKLSGAIARAADLAVVHGRDALRGTPLVGISNNSYINATQNRVTLDFSAPAGPGDVIDQFIAGWKMVTDENNGPGNYEVTHMAAVPSIRPDLMTIRRSDGTPLFNPGGVPSTGSEINLYSGGVGSLLGIPTSFHRVVGGRIGNNAGTNVKVLAGDWSQLCYGYADAISVRISDQASLVDEAGETINLWQTNQIAVLAEATFGWYVNDPNAFVAYEVADESS